MMIVMMSMVTTTSMMSMYDHVHHSSSFELIGKNSFLVWDLGLDVVEYHPGGDA